MLLTMKGYLVSWVRVVVIATVLTVGMGVVVSYFMSPPSVRADVVLPGGDSIGGNSSCDRGGIAGCPWTSNGHGWRKISINDANGPSGNGRWGGGVRACRQDGATHIVAYLVFTGERTQKTAYIYNFNYSKFSDNWAGFNGSMTTASAEKMFNSLSSAARRGYTFGSNVGMFCWNDNPPWVINVTSSVDKEFAEVGNQVKWTHTIVNDGPNATNKDITWRYQNRGAWPNTSGPSWVLDRDTKSGAKATKTSTYIIQPSDFGKKICRSVRAAPRSNVDSGVKESNEACVTVGKYPKVHILGNDLLVGRGSLGNIPAVSNINTSVSRVDNGRYYGSWAEYGITASGLVRGMASASGYAGGVSTGELCRLSLLTFTNADRGNCSSSNIGAYRFSTSIPSIRERFKVNSTTPRLSGVVDVTGANVQGIYTSSQETLSLSSTGALAAGKWAVINAPNTTVTIVSNLTYTNAPLRSLATIPQLVIIAKNIIVADSVGRIDAWLFAVGSGADGYLNTCGAGSVGRNTALSLGRCGAQLVVNGPIAANHLMLRRTHGAEFMRPNVPAEVFNLRGDAYLWAIGQELSSTKLPTAEVKELPPRF